MRGLRLVAAGDGASFVTLANGVEEIGTVVISGCVVTVTEGLMTREVVGDEGEMTTVVSVAGAAATMAGWVVVDARGAGTVAGRTLMVEVVEESTMGATGGMISG